MTELIDRTALVGRGLVAIVRGVRPDEAVAIGRCLYVAGFRVMEVPLNSPEPLTSVRRLREALPSDMLVGVGTVLTVSDVADAVAARAQLVVSPCLDDAVVRATVAGGLLSCPGVATPSEAFRALRTGAHVIKIFPCDQVGQAGLKAWGSVLPPGTPLMPVGGVTPESMQAWRDAGATGFGIGSALYRAGRPVAEVSARAAEFVDAFRRLS